MKLFGLDSTHKGQLPIPDFGVFATPALSCVGCSEFAAKLKLGEGLQK